MRIPTTVFCLLLSLAACNENEEEIVIHPDGSVDVSVRAKGGVGDLDDGHPLPLHGPWIAGNRASELWLERVGPETGGVLAPARAAAVDWAALGLLVDGDKLELAARARFGSVADWPRFFAPPTDPYREAALERSAELRIEQRGKYRVYTFERTYHGRRRDRYDLFHLIFEQAESFPAAIIRKLENEEPLTFEETRFVAQKVSLVFRDVYGLFAVDALDLGEDDGIAPSVRARIAETARERMALHVDEARIARLLEKLRDEDSEDDEHGDDALEALEREARDLLRRTLADELVAEGIDEPLRWTMLGRLEFGFSFADHTADLSDEKFAVELSLPGTVVSGNYDELEDGRAVWHFDFDALATDDVVLRAISIVE